jgi:hypothetical protein
MNDARAGSEWRQATDEKWYRPELRPIEPTPSDLLSPEQPSGAMPVEASAPRRLTGSKVRSTAVDGQLGGVLDLGPHWRTSFIMCPGHVTTNFDTSFAVPHMIADPLPRWQGTAWSPANRAFSKVVG